MNGILKACDCTGCGGRGFVWVAAPSGNGWATRTCEKCKGSGKRCTL
jgi:hypothetical protein